MKKSLISFLLMSSFIFTGCSTNNYKNRIVNINGYKYTISEETNENIIGWSKINNNIYYTDSTGIIQTGWQLIDNNWYYFYEEGIMACNTYVDNYYLNENGCWTNELPIETKEEKVQVKITNSLRYKTLSWRYRQNNRNELEYVCEKYNIKGGCTKHYGNYGYELNKGDSTIAIMYVKVQGDKVLERKLGEIIQ